MSIEIKLAQEIGFCFGVRDAIDKAKSNAPAETLGQLAHNRDVIDNLMRSGICPVHNLDEVKGDRVIVTAHGAPPEVINQIKARNLELIDCTCPIVRTAQQTCRRLADQGYTVVIFGDRDHTEVRGLLGWGEGKAIATTDGRFARGNHGDRVAIISQTTQNRHNLCFFSQYFLHDRVLPNQLLIVDTTCKFVQRRQAEAIQMAQEVDVTLVIGSKISANTRNLASLCSQYCTTHHIEDKVELERLGKLDGRIGVCAGTSTPMESINEVVQVLKNEATRQPVSIPERTSY